MATGAAMGAVKVRAPGFAVVQVAAAPPPVPPSTTDQVAGIPPAKFSFKATRVPERSCPTLWVKEPLHVPWSLLTWTLTPRSALQAAAAGTLSVKCGAPDGDVPLGARSG